MAQQTTDYAQKAEKQGYHKQDGLSGGDAHQADNNFCTCTSGGNWKPGLEVAGLVGETADRVLLADEGGGDSQWTL